MSRPACDMFGETIAQGQLYMHEVGKGQVYVNIRVHGLIMRQRMGHRADNERRANIVRTSLKDW
jgi:hypothetical protein